MRRCPSWQTARAVASAARRLDDDLCRLRVRCRRSQAALGASRPRQTRNSRTPCTKPLQNATGRSRSGALIKLQSMADRVSSALRDWATRRSLRVLRCPRAYSRPAISPLSKTFARRSSRSSSSSSWRRAADPPMSLDCPTDRGRAQRGYARDGSGHRSRRCRWRRLITAINLWRLMVRCARRLGWEAKPLEASDAWLNRLRRDHPSRLGRGRRRAASAGAVGAQDGRVVLGDQPDVGEGHGELLGRNRRTYAEAIGSWRPPPLDTPHGLLTFGAQFAEVAVDPDLASYVSGAWSAPSRREGC